MLEKLKEPFDPKDIEWRAGATNKDKTRALALAYITSRAVMDRLDEVCGLGGWKDEYRPGPSGGVICGISVRVDEEWITKWDGADNTQVEEVKGGLSDAFKRAGVKWGIGRYLYNLEGVWVACEQRGKSVVLSETPRLPPWAVPAGATAPVRKPPKAETLIGEITGDGPKPNGNGSAHPHQWLIDDGLVNHAKHATNLANLLDLADLDEGEQRDRVSLYRAWKDYGLDTDPAAEFAKAGKLPDEAPEEVE